MVYISDTRALGTRQNGIFGPSKRTIFLLAYPRFEDARNLCDALRQDDNNNVSRSHVSSPYGVRIY